MNIGLSCSFNASKDTDTHQASLIHKLSVRKNKEILLGNESAVKKSMKKYNREKYIYTMYSLCTGYCVLNTNIRVTARDGSTRCLPHRGVFLVLCQY